MTSKKENEQKIVLQDSPDVRYVVVEIDLKNEKTRILTSLEHWGIIRVLAQGIGMTYQTLVNQGENPATVYSQLEKILVNMLQTKYEFTDEDKKEVEIKNGKKEIKKEAKSPKGRQAKGSRKTADKSRKGSSKTKGASDSKQSSSGHNKSKAKQSGKPSRKKKKSKK